MLVLTIHEHLGIMYAYEGWTWWRVMWGIALLVVIGWTFWGFVMVIVFVAMGQVPPIIMGWRYRKCSSLLGSEEAGAQDYTIIMGLILSAIPLFSFVFGCIFFRSSILSTLLYKTQYKKIRPKKYALCHVIYAGCFIIFAVGINTYVVRNVIDKQ